MSKEKISRICQWCGHDNRIPVGVCDVTTEGEMIIYKCPDCGVVLYKHDTSIHSSFRFYTPVICCGRRRM